MKRDLEIEILMQDYCTRSEAEKHLEEGTTIYSDSEKEDYIENCEAGMIDREEAEEMWDALKAVTYKGQTYHIDYVL